MADEEQQEATAPDQVEWVAMKYEGVDGVATATKAAFDEVHAPNGWTKVADLGLSSVAPTYDVASVVAEAVGEVEGNLTDLTKSDLQEVARAAGLDDSGTKDEIAARIDEAANPGGN
jgi:hypothetical protein